jgi:hypothetical protein
MKRVFVPKFDLPQLSTNIQRGTFKIHKANIALTKPIFSYDQLQRLF